MDYLDSKCLESLMIEDYHLSIANEGFGDFLKNIGQKFVAILKFFGRMIGNFIKFLKGLFNKKGDNGGSDSSSGSSKSSSKSSGSKSKGISDEDANKWAKALADKTNAAFNARNHNLVVFLAKVVTKISNVSSTLNYSGKIISNISKVGPSKLAEDIESLKKYYEYIMDIRYDLVDARDEIKMHPEEFYYDPSDKGKLDKLIDELTKSKDKCLEVVYKFDDSVILIKHEFEDKNTGRTIYETINEVADAAAACCDCIGSIINSATKVKVLNKSVETARAAGVPEDKILKSKKDIDNYFNK